MEAASLIRIVTLSIAVGAALAAASAPALAFQEQAVGGGDAAKAAGSAPASQLPGLNLKLPDLDIAKNAGTEVGIPGVGTLGVLPKLDFGLELLYGANDSAGTRPDDRSQPSDVQIRGTIKHRF